MTKNFGLSETIDDDSPSKEDLQYNYEMSDDVCFDLIDYSRSRIVRNEEQFLLTTLGYLSGFMENPSHFVSGVLIGTAGSGKTHLQHQLEDLFPDDYLYQTTSGSEKSIIYDDTWEDAYIASLDELQKPGETIIEILKSLHGDDEEYEYQVTGDGRGADRDVDTITRTAIPYWFLYAQYEPDFEMWDRLLKIPVHESRDKNVGVLRTKWDHSSITFGKSEYEYMYDFEDGFKALKDHIRNMPKNSWVKIPAGEPELNGYNFIKYAEPIFDVDRSETNRVGAMVANLVRASCLVNYKNRQKKSVNVPNEGPKEVYIPEPQDLANVLSCRDILMATTHQLDRKKKAICVAIEENGNFENEASIDEIQEHLRKTNASFVKRHQIVDMLTDLQENYLVEKLERAGNNGTHLYKFKGWQNLGKFEINEEFKEFFDGCVNPVTGEDFIDTARRLNEELTPKASDFMSESSVSSDSGSGQATLSDEPAETFPELEPHEEAVRSMLHDTLDGETIDNIDENEPSLRQMLGVAPMDGQDDDGSIEGTIFEPTHEVWSHGPDEWVDSVNDAENEIENALRRLTKEGVFKTSVLARRGGAPKKIRIEVSTP